MEGALSVDLAQIFPDSDVSVESRIQIGDTDPSWSGYDHRRLYLVARTGRHG